VQKQQLFHFYTKYDRQKKNQITWSEFERVTKQLVPDIHQQEFEALKVNLSKNNAVDLIELKAALEYKEGEMNESVKKKQVGFDLGG
jgi:Ca2+-binding EF-hand superfamily protein